MNIKFEKLERKEGQKANGDVWVAYSVVGTKISDGSAWTSGNIFDNKHNKDVLEAFSTLDQGDKVNVEMKQQNGYWNVTGVGPVKDNPRGSSSQAKQGAASSGNKDAMSKAEWAEKDKVTRESIARAVALKEANRNTIVGHIPSEIIDMAKAFEPYLLGEGDDPLDPPSV